MQYGSMAAKLRSFAFAGSYVVTALFNMHRSAKSIRDNPRTGKRHIDEKTLGEMEAFARELGISKIGYTKVNSNFIFRDFEILYDNAILFMMEMNKEIIATNPSNEAGREIWRTYEPWRGG